MSTSKYITVITSHQIHLASDPEGILKAHASIVVNGAIKVNSIRIVLINGTLQIKWPKNSSDDPDLRHIVHPVDAGFRKLAESFLIEAFHRVSDSTEYKRLFLEKLNLQEQKDKAREERRNALADALQTAIESIEEEIQKI